jgi:hypothetical protein
MAYFIASSAVNNESCAKEFRLKKNMGQKTKMLYC